MLLLKSFFEVAAQFYNFVTNQSAIPPLKDALNLDLQVDEFTKSSYMKIWF